MHTPAPTPPSRGTQPLREQPLDAHGRHHRAVAAVAQREQAVARLAHKGLEAEEGGLAHKLEQLVLAGRLSYVEGV